MEPNVLTVYETSYDKRRVGKEYDGGYVISVIPEVKYDVLLAGGIENDISFEEEFCSLYKDTKCLAYDGTVDDVKITHPNVSFIKKNIGKFENDTYTNLHNEIDKYENIMIKMDIEGSEIDWLESLTDKHYDKFVQIVMEFHTPFGERELAVFKRLNETHLLVHFHANNCCGLRYVNGILVPNIFECTYVHKRYINQPYILNKKFLPTDIDMKNVDKDDIYITWPPFVNY